MAPCVRNGTGEGACDASGQDWTRTEAEAATFPDARLHRRFAGLLRQLAAGVGASIPLACGDWSGAKAASTGFRLPTLWRRVAGRKRRKRSIPGKPP